MEESLLESSRPRTERRNRRRGCDCDELLVEGPQRRIVGPSSNQVDGSDDVTDRGESGDECGAQCRQPVFQHSRPVATTLPAVDSDRGVDSDAPADSDTPVDSE